MSEQDTYNKLKRIPLDEIMILVDISQAPRSVAPTYMLGNSIMNSSTYYHRDLEIQRWRQQILEKHGWTFEDLVVELEKKAILEQVAEFNKEHQIPRDIMDRARQYFPNVKFVHAHVELE